MYKKEFEIRWSDIDANRHLANTAYLNFMSHTRIAFLAEHGFGQQELIKFNLGPVVFHEHIHYFREVFAGKPVTVTLELKGLSEDGMYFEFAHDLYNSEGINVATCELMGGWISLKDRKLTTLPKHFLENLKSFPQTADFRILTKEDTRKFGKKPKPVLTDFGDHE